MEKPPVQFKLMLPADLKSELEEVAAKSRRSLSAEIVFQLASFKKIDELNKKLEDIEGELKDQRNMNVFMSKGYSRHYNNMKRHVVITKAFCLAIMKHIENENNVWDIYSMADEFHSVYDSLEIGEYDFEETEYLRKIVRLSHEEIDMESLDKKFAAINRTESETDTD